MICNIKMVLSIAFELKGPFFARFKIANVKRRLKNPHELLKNKSVIVNVAATRAKLT